MRAALWGKTTKNGRKMNKGYRGIKNIVFAGAGDWAQTVAFMLSDPLRYQGTHKDHPHYRIQMLDQPAERMHALRAVQSGDINLSEAQRAAAEGGGSSLDKYVAQYVKCDFGRPDISDQFEFHDLNGARGRIISEADLIISGVSSDGFNYWSKHIATHNSSNIKEYDEPAVEKFKQDYGLNSPVLILTKGLVDEGLVYPTDKLEEDSANHEANGRPTPLIVAYGGTIGKQVRQWVPSEVNIGVSANTPKDVREYYAELFTDILSLNEFRASRIEKDDALLMQVGASAKNIYALSFGMLKEITKWKRSKFLDQLGLEDTLGDDYTNLIGLFVPQAQKEMAGLYYRILKRKLRGVSTLRPLDRFGQPSFFGDLATTMGSENSRNFRGGTGIAKAYNKRLDAGNNTPSRKVIDRVCSDIGEVVEGIRATEMYYQAISKKSGIRDMQLRFPVLYFAYHVVNGDILPHSASDIIFNMPRNRKEQKLWHPNGLGS